MYSLSLFLVPILSQNRLGATGIERNVRRIMPQPWTTIRGESAAGDGGGESWGDRNDVRFAIAETALNLFDHWIDILHSSPWCAYENAIPVPIQVHDNSPITLPRFTRASEAARRDEHIAPRVALHELLSPFSFMPSLLPD